ncbi:MAG: hypothetical protein ABSG68_17455 [Thermoguttaceae bacterium]|jgi:hypothetical protein
MNENENKNSGDDDCRLDRLVDGELSEAERCLLLEQFEREPEGWRRCALAFLESQCWRKELTAIVRPPAQATATVPASTARQWSQRLRLALAMAAGFLVALVVSSHWNAIRTGPAPAAIDVAGAQRPSPGVIAQPALAPGPPPAPWQMVTVSAAASPAGGAETIELPAVERDHLDPAWLQALPDAVPDEVVEALKRTGHAVQQHRELLPLPMNDGRRLVVPVDRVEVHYVGRPAL